MFDKKAFDLEMESERREQLISMTEYLSEFIKLSDGIRDCTISPQLDEKAIKAVEEIPIPEKGRPAKEVANELIDKVFSHCMTLQHPRFFSFVASAVSPYSVEGAVLTDIFNPHGGGYTIAPTACLIEEKVVKWMGSLAGYPQETCGGVFVSGGSTANITALMTARGKKLSEDEYGIGVAYLSDQTHVSVAKGLRLIGLRRDQIVTIPTDDDFRMRTDLLEEAIKKDKAAGRKPFLVVGSMGTTNTGSIDPLSEIGDICGKYDMWFHIDGAFGGSILISDIYRNLSKGIEKSDSFSWDTHKWALQVYGCSTIVVKDKDNMLDVFSEHPEYLADVKGADHYDPWDMSIEMTRPHRAIKLWFTLQAMGTDKLADVIDYAFYNSHQAEKRLKEYENWELTSKPMCGTITFRYAPKGLTEAELDKLNGEISERINKDGYAYIVTSTVKEKRVLRMCMINGTTTTDDVLDTVDYLNTIADEIYKAEK